jgi:hypothetical protein
MTVDLDVRLTVDDLIPPHCPWGLRAFWKLHGLDFADFLKNGIPASAMLTTGDASAAEAVARKLEALRGE